MASCPLQNFISRAYKFFKQAIGNGSCSSSSVDQLPLHSSDKWTSELKPISDCMNSLNAENIRLHDLVKQISPQTRKPITFIDVCQNSIMNAVIILIAPGHAIPLHDHPGMFGMIKVLQGQIKIKSYTLSATSNDAGYHGNETRLLPALRIPDVILSSSCYPQVLSPYVRNIHEIECVVGEGEHNYAAFLDILSPPYKDESSCHYFQSDEADPKKPFFDTNSPKKCHLKETSCPRDYQTGNVMM